MDHVFELHAASELGEEFDYCVGTGDVDGRTNQCGSTAIADFWLAHVAQLVRRVDVLCFAHTEQQGLGLRWDKGKNNVSRVLF